MTNQQGIALESRPVEEVCWLPHCIKKHLVSLRKPCLSPLQASGFATTKGTISSFFLPSVTNNDIFFPCSGFLAFHRVLI